MKVFVGLKEIAGYYQNLMLGLEAIGIECVFIDLVGHRYGYEYQLKNSWIRLFVHAHRKMTKKRLTKNVCIRKLSYLGCILLRIPIFIWALFKFDAFLFSFESTFFSFYELPLLRLMKKKIVYRFHGDDCRPPYLSGGIAGNLGEIDAKRIIKLSFRKRRHLERIEKYAHVIISNPLFSHFLRRPFILATRIGVPLKIEEGLGHTQYEHNDVGPGNKTRIVHAPSDPVIKGTEQIRRAIYELEQDGYEFEFTELQGAKNCEVIRALGNCDFVVDQIYSDTPMSGLAAEAARLGKPSVVCGYAGEEFSRIYPDGCIPPSWYSHPSKLKDSILNLHKNKRNAVELGQEAREFVCELWNAKRVAQRFMRIFEADIPNNWWYDPKNIGYLHGAGLSEERVKEILRGVIKAGGLWGLQISDKQKLQERLVEFATS